MELTIGDGKIPSHKIIGQKQSWIRFKPYVDRWRNNEILYVFLTSAVYEYESVGNSTMATIGLWWSMLIAPR